MNAGLALRQRMSESGLVHVMAAHSPLSARLAQEAGFDAIWASGFELSALYGLPDASLVTMTQHLEMVRAIADQCDIPIVADLDTGFGNAINVIHAVKQYERAGVAAVIIEDKSFPKMTSLLPGGRQELLRIAEFQGKIAAAVESKKNPDLLIIARTEALIAGLGQDEALQRGLAYEDAGADLIVVHSKSKTPAEVERFARSWRGNVPIVLIPTAYPDLDADRIKALQNVRMVIYGNHAIRASIAAMKEVFANIRKNGGIHKLGDEIVTVAEVFRLQGMTDLERNEERFLR